MIIDPSVTFNASVMFFDMSLNGISVIQQNNRHEYYTARANWVEDYPTWNQTVDKLNALAQPWERVEVYPSKTCNDLSTSSERANQVSGYGFYSLYRCCVPLPKGGRRG